MVDFWLNHFNVYCPERAGALDGARLRAPGHAPACALGRFRDLVIATAQHPAMLYYLDNWLSARRDGFTLPRREAAREAGAQRELRARADGAAHAGRGRRLYAGGRGGGRPLLHGLDHRSPAAGRGIPLPIRASTTEGRSACWATAIPAGGGEGRRSGASSTSWLATRRRRASSRPSSSGASSATTRRRRWSSAWPGPSGTRTATSGRCSSTIFSAPRVPLRRRVSRQGQDAAGGGGQRRARPGRPARSGHRRPPRRAARRCRAGRRARAPGGRARASRSTRRSRPPAIPTWPRRGSAPARC